jgi:hypothetical protein
MRKILPLYVLLCTGCPGLGQVGFDIDTNGSSQFQGNPAAGLLTVFPSFGGFGNIDFSQKADFQNNNTRKDHVVEARLSKLTLKVVNPLGDTLGFISTVEFDVGATGLPTVRIAEATIPAGVSTVDLTIDNQDMAAYVKADNFSITTKGTGHSPVHDTTIEADLTMHIVANVL